MDLKLGSILCSIFVGFIFVPSFAMVHSRIVEPNSINEEGEIRSVWLGYGFHLRESIIIRKKTDSLMGYSVQCTLKTWKGFII
jgi:hypothetical protein